MVVALAGVLELHLHEVRGIRIAGDVGQIVIDIELAALLGATSIGEAAFGEEDGRLRPWPIRLTPHPPLFQRGGGSGIRIMMLLFHIHYILFTYILFVESFIILHQILSSISLFPLFLSLSSPPLWKREGRGSPY